MAKKILKTGHIIFYDEQDAELVNKYNWIPERKIGQYVKAWINGKFHYLHRLILYITDPQIFVDHKDGNGLNNKRDNIRICTRSENARNRKASGQSKYLGVCRKYGKWLAQINISGKQTYLGLFEIEDDAARAYNNAAIELKDPFRRLNKIKG